MSVVVVDADQPVGQALGEARMVEHALTARRPVRPQDLAFPVELENPARARVVGHEIEIGSQLLGIRRVRDRKVHGPYERAGGRVFGDPGSVDLRDEEVAVCERRVAIRVAQRGRRVVRAVARGADLETRVGRWHR